MLGVRDSESRVCLSCRDFRICGLLVRVGVLG